MRIMMMTTMMRMMMKEASFHRTKGVWEFHFIHNAPNT